jgi:hypothetical protein
MIGHYPETCGGPGCCSHCAAEHLRGLAGRAIYASIANSDLLSTGDGGGEARALLRKALLILPTCITRDEITAFLAGPAQ